MDHIKKEWEDFRRTCVPANAPGIHVNDMEVAFYGGALTMFNLMNRAVAGGDYALIGDIHAFFADRLGMRLPKARMN